MSMASKLSNSFKPKVRLAIVGCGAISKTVHIPMVLSNNRVDLVSLVDLNKKRAALLCKEFQISPKIYGQTEDLEEVDAAIVALPHNLLSDVAISLMAKGVHVLCEKPMAKSSKDAEKMIEASKKFDHVLTVGFMKRFLPNTKLVKKILEDGLLGEITGFEFQEGFVSNWGAENQDRFNPKVEVGGVLGHASDHWINLFIYFFGLPTVIFYEDDALGGVECNANMVLEFGTGTKKFLGKCRFSWSDPLKNELLIHGTKGELRQKLNDPRGVTIFQEITGKAYEFYLSSDPSYTPMDEFRLQLEAFLDAITTVENRSVSPEEAYKVLRVVEAAYNQRSMMDQPWVHVKTIFKVSDG